MSQLQNVQPTYLPKMKEGKTVTKSTGMLLIGFLAFVLIALVAYLTVPTIFPITEAKEVTSHSTNPELSIAGHYAVGAPVSAGINLFTASPELSVAWRYAEVKVMRAEGGSLSVNPELARVHGGFSGDDAYDPAVLDVPFKSEGLIGGSFSGDDGYDPAVLNVPGSSGGLSGGSYSGDDDYDLAAGSVS